MEQLTAEQFDVLLLVVLGICVAVVADQEEESGASIAAHTIGFVAWMLLAVPFVFQFIGGTVEDTGINWIKLGALVGVAIWIGVREPSGGTSAPSSASSSGGTSTSSDSGLTTADGVRVEVGNGVWSQNHWPWSITSVDAGWVHLVYDWDSSEQESSMIAVEDFDRYYYKHHPSGPMSCATAGCRYRSWGER